MNRIGNILRSADAEEADVEPTPFHRESEKNLFDQIKRREADAATLLSPVILSIPLMPWLH